MAELSSLSDHHNWCVLPNIRPIFCNVCCESLHKVTRSGVTINGLACEGDDDDDDDDDDGDDDDDDDDDGDDDDDDGYLHRWRKLWYYQSLFDNRPRSVGRRAVLRVRALTWTRFVSLVR